MSFAFGTSLPQPQPMSLSLSSGQAAAVDANSASNLLSLFLVKEGVMLPGTGLLLSISQAHDTLLGTFICNMTPKRQRRLLRSI